MICSCHGTGRDTEDKPNQTSTHITSSVHITFTSILLAKASHMAEPKVKREEHNTKRPCATWVHRMTKEEEVIPITHFALFLNNPERQAFSALLFIDS